MRSRTLSATPRNIGGNGSISVLDQAPLALGASDGTSKDPKREGQQHNEKSEQGEQWLRHCRQAVTLNQHLPDALKAVSGGKNERDVAEFWSGVSLEQLGREKHSRK